MKTPPFALSEEGAENEPDVEHCIDVCNSILRGEISAAEAYDKAIEKFPHETETPMLQEIHEEHLCSVELLSELVLEMHGIPELKSGAWGNFTSAIQSTANFFGEESALRSLQRGEELGQQAYEDALIDRHITPECKALIRNRLLPAVNQHIDRIDTISEAIHFN